MMVLVVCTMAMYGRVHREATYLGTQGGIYPGRDTHHIHREYIPT